MTCDECNGQDEHEVWCNLVPSAVDHVEETLWCARKAGLVQKFFLGPRATIETARAVFANDFVRGARRPEFMTVDGWTIEQVVS